MLDALLQPIQVGTSTWKNRMVKTPSSLEMFSPGQHMNEQTYNAHEAMAAGGAAAVIMEASLFIDPGVPEYPFAGLYDDKFIPEWEEMSRRIHKYDCKLIAQIFHYSASFNIPGGAICSTTVKEEDLPSPPPFYFPSRGVTLEEIAQIKADFIDAAERAQKGGADGIEVHVANGYLFVTFMSRIWNKRTDEYGGCLENRARLAVECIQGVRERCGRDFIIGVRMNGQEFGHPDGQTIEEATAAAKLFEEAGADYISVTAYGFGKVPFQYSVDFWNYPEPDPDMVQYLDRLNKDGLVIPAAAAIKKAVSVPVISVGSGLEEDKANRIISEGKIDIAGFSRGIWADNDLPSKVEKGVLEDIRHCNHCGTCDDGPNPRRCRVNPALGREKELEIIPTTSPKHILVVGGGCAGMNAAITLAQRGHKVTLAEHESFLAPKMWLATMVKGTETEKVPALIQWLTTQVNKNENITVKLKTDVDRKFIEKLNPDEVVIATGGVYDRPNIPGANLRIVQTVPSLWKLASKPLKMFGADSLSKLSKIALPTVGKNVVVLGAQLEGVQGSMFLYKRGKNVVMLDEKPTVGAGIPPRYLRRTLPYFERKGIKAITGVKLLEITKKGISYLDANGDKQFMPADTIMDFRSPVPNTTLSNELNGLKQPIHVIGAALGDGHTLMVDAMRDSRELGVAL